MKDIPNDAYLILDPSNPNKIKYQQQLNAVSPQKHISDMAQSYTTIGSVHKYY